MSTSTERMRRLRERRAAGLAPAPGQEPRDPDDCLAPALEVTLAALNLGPADAGLAQLARMVAETIDRAADHRMALVKFGPRFLRLLQELNGAAKTPRRRRG